MTAKVGGGLSASKRHHMGLLMMDPPPCNYSATNRRYPNISQLCCRASSQPRVAANGGCLSSQHLKDCHGGNPNPN
ncbi:hypothetical protein TanjilG_03624 [Lupinus angustifolius]|uniref:Uncharacterized protein n=1 Tax=Lupinus angustifolius TaxID=3871 RepID=A0A4P1RW92_LUPAN|nr:hypothetical protein TanjilG_03624 [Lupinus angustifolius]